MTSPKPHFLLFCDGNVPVTGGESAGGQRGRWRFVLEDLATGEKIEATDQEVGCAPDRTALVAVLRGLEALEQPSRVTLVTTSRYVTRGLQYGLLEWRENDYSWEHFGAVQPIRNADIWKRIDRALAFHQVQCRWMAQDAGTDSVEESSPCEDAREMNATTATEMGTVATKRSTTTQHTHRQHTTQAVRSTLSTSKYQRVYVDTPSRGNAACSSDCIGLNEVAVARIEGGLQKHEKTKKALSTKEKSAWNSSRIATLCLWPFCILFCGPLWLWSHFWEVILAVDEWLESFLRCLLLLDPSKRTTRH